MGKVVLESVVKRYGDVEVVRSLDLTIHHGEFLTLLGPSGCGKTTTLMMIAGFERPTTGRIWMDGTDVTAQPPFLRNVNTVFQNYALFPHLRVFDNVAFGLRARRTPRGEIPDRVHGALDLVQMRDLASRWPRQLSGGQQQRVALARALVMQPEVLLLDEPLGALDLKLRREMQLELKQLQRKLGMTFVFVTHDQEEALTMSDRIVIMNNGQVEQVGAPAEVYDRPRTRFVAGFVGEANLLPASLIEYSPAGALVEALGMRMLLPSQVSVTGRRALICVRPERMRLATTPTQSGLAADVVERIYTGSGVRLVARGPGGNLLLAQALPGTPLAALTPGEKARFTWDPADCVLLADSETAGTPVPMALPPAAGEGARP